MIKAVFLCFVGIALLIVAGIPGVMESSVTSVLQELEAIIIAHCGFVMIGLGCVVDELAKKNK